MILFLKSEKKVLFLRDNNEILRLILQEISFDSWMDTCTFFWNRFNMKFNIKLLERFLNTSDSDYLKIWIIVKFELE